MMMMTELMEKVKDWEDEDEVSAWLEKILRGEVSDHSGLIYGIGHAVYTLSDPACGDSARTCAASLPEKRVC